MEEHQISVVTGGYPDLHILIKAVSNVCGISKAAFCTPARDIGAAMPPSALRVRLLPQRALPVGTRNACRRGK